MSDSSNRTRYCANCLTTFLGNPEIGGNNECKTNRPGTHWGKLLEPGERIDGRFRIDRRLRIAAAGPTYLCQETDEAEQAIGSLLVLQVISPEAVEQDEYFQRLKNEIRILNDLEHPNLVRAHPYLPPETGPPFIVMDYETGGTLMDQLREAGAMSLAHIAQLGLQICDGMRAAHRENLFQTDDNKAGRNNISMLGGLGNLSSRGCLERNNNLPIRIGQTRDGHNLLSPGRLSGGLVP